MPALDGLSGIVVGAIFGSIFVLTCITSAIKAVRDRSRIQKRRAMRRKAKVDKEIDFCNEEDQPKPSTHIQSECLINDKCSKSTSVQNDNMNYVECSVFSVDTGVDNLTFQQSNTCVNYVDEIQYLSLKKLIPLDETVSSCQTFLPQRAKSHEANFRRKRNLDHLSTECLVIKKMKRRHSYEIAVCENSWLPKEPPYFASSKYILNTYRYGVNNGNSVKTSQVGFENKAFDKFDYKNT